MAEVRSALLERFFYPEQATCRHRLEVVSHRGHGVPVVGVHHDVGLGVEAPCELSDLDVAPIGSSEEQVAAVIAQRDGLRRNVEIRVAERTHSTLFIRRCERLHSSHG